VGADCPLSEKHGDLHGMRTCFFVVLSWRVCGWLWTVKSEGLPQLSPQAALYFDL
jgi:hypothetical protein